MNIDSSIPTRFIEPMSVHTSTMGKLLNDLSTDSQNAKDTEGKLDAARKTSFLYAILRNYTSITTETVCRVWKTHFSSTCDFDIYDFTGQVTQVSAADNNETYVVLDPTGLNQAFPASHNSQATAFVDLGRSEKYGGIMVCDMWGMDLNVPPIQVENLYRGRDYVLRERFPKIIVPADSTELMGTPLVGWTPKEVQELIHTGLELFEDSKDHTVLARIDVSKTAGKMHLLFNALATQHYKTNKAPYVILYGIRDIMDHVEPQNFADRNNLRFARSVSSGHKSDRPLPRPRWPANGRELTDKEIVQNPVFMQDWIAKQRNTFMHNNAMRYVDAFDCVLQFRGKEANAVHLPEETAKGRTLRRFSMITDGSEKLKFLQNLMTGRTHVRNHLNCCDFREVSHTTENYTVGTNPVAQWVQNEHGDWGNTTAICRLFDENGPTQTFGKNFAAQVDASETLVQVGDLHFHGQSRSQTHRILYPLGWPPHFMTACAVGLRGNLYGVTRYHDVAIGFFDERSELTACLKTATALPAPLLDLITSYRGIGNRSYRSITCPEHMPSASAAAASSSSSYGGVTRDLQPEWEAYMARRIMQGEF